MKKVSFFSSLVFVIILLLLVLSGCISAPVSSSKAPESVPAASPAQNRSNDIWAMLQRGDEKARGFFLGEIDVNSSDAQGRTPLHYAAENQDYQLAAFFISLGANVDALDKSNMSPLGISVEKNDAKTAEVLANAKADIHLPINNNTSAAFLALGKNTGIFKSILTRDNVEKNDSNGMTVLHIACIAGNIQAVNDIISMPVTTEIINRKDKTNKNALDYAFNRPDSFNHMVISERLILTGGFSENPMFSYFAPAVRSGNYNIRRSEGLAPLHYAVINNYSGLYSLLLERNIDVNIKSASGATALHEAVRTGNIPIIKSLLENGADVNARDARGNSPLHIGVPSDTHREVISILLSNKAYPNLRDEHGDTPLHIAIILNRSLDVVQLLLGGGSDVFIRNIEGKTPLYIAVYERREAVIPVLLSYGSEVFAACNSNITPFDLAFRGNGNIFNLLVTSETVAQRDSYGNTMLHAAVRNRGTTQQLGVILDNRAPVEARNRDGDTALHLAVRTNQRESGEYLISRGANIFSVNSEDESPLFIALSASGGIRQWIINPATINARDGAGNNMLHYAAGWKLDNAIPVIIRNGVSVNDKNATGETALFMAARTDSPSTIKVLFDNKADINARDTHGNSVLHSAVKWNSVNAASALISNGIDINAFSLNGNTPLHDAVTLDKPEMESLLIKEKANIEARNNEGNTPLMEAVRIANITSAQRLITSGADINTRNTRGDTPLHIAVGQERTDIVNLILAQRSSIHARNTSNITPFQIALGVSPGMTSALLTNDRINVPDDLGNSVLHIAIQERASENILRSIISKGARVNAVDNNGRTPLRLAVDTFQWASIKILADAGADPFLAAIDNKNPAEIAFLLGEECIKALFSGRAINARDSSQNTVLHLAARYGTPENINTLLGLGANRQTRNISSEIPYEIAVRWNRIDNAELLKVSSF